MAPPIPSREPNSIFAGDTVKFSRTFADYPATAWTLAYLFRGPSELVEQTAAVSGSGFLMTIDAGDTERLLAGTYQWSARATSISSGETYTVARGVLEVVLVAGAVVQSHNEKMLAAINAALEGRVVADVQLYTIGGRMVTKIPFEKLLHFKGVYEAKVFRDRNPGRIGVPVAVAFPPPDGGISGAEPVSLPPWYAGAR